MSGQNNLIPDSSSLPHATRTASDAIYQIVEGHDGQAIVLYRTFAQADSARQARTSLKDSNAVNEHLAEARMGSLSRHEDGSVYAYGVKDLVGFQATGLIVVMLVLSGLSVLCYALTYLLRKLKLTADAAPIPTPVPAVSLAVPAADPSTTIHPGLSDEKLVLLLTLVASQMSGRPVHVVQFRPMSSTDWAWAVQGRTSLHANRLV